MTESEVISDIAINTIKEILKSSVSSVQEFGSWLSKKNKEYDPLGIAAKNYIQKLSDRYSHIRVIGMDTPVPLRTLFVRVQILEKLSSLQSLSIKQLEELFYGQRESTIENRMSALKESDSHNNESLRNVRETISGLELIEKEDKVIILGKPGAGKTTFLKSLTLSALDGKLPKNLLPIYINLKNWADSGTDLMSFVERQFEICEFPDSGLFVHSILKNGKCLVLLDGLDEAIQSENRIIVQIEDFVDQYTENKFIITCRMAASNYIFEKFTEVEIADFNENQIKEFIYNWFTDNAKTASLCWDRLKVPSNSRILNLASTPLLLTLICINFESALSFPDNKAELYKDALDILLKKWDSSRNIARAQIYKEMSLRKKETLLSQIAFDTFKEGQYFFKRKNAERYIQRFIVNLSKINQSTIEVDSQKILNSIEAQHGLLIERAKNIYSFSHLTLQEYFTSKFIIDNLSKAEINQIFEETMLNPRWREVYVITAGALAEADDFLNKILKTIQTTYQTTGVSKILKSTEGFIRKNEYFPIEIRRILALYSTLDLDAPREFAKQSGVKLARLRSDLLAIINLLARSYSANNQFSVVLHLSDSIRNDNAKEFAHSLNKSLNFNSDINKTNGTTLDLSISVVKNLELYLRSYKSLLDFLNADCYVTNSTRSTIHSQILSPIKTT